MGKTFRHQKKKLFVLFIALMNMTSAVFATTAGVEGMDGIIATGEYPASASFAEGSFVIHWRLTDDTIRIAIDAVSAGWVALGLNPRSVMDQADMIFGIVPAEGASGDVLAVDAFSDGTFGPHPEDTSVGGGNDILAFAGLRSGNRVVFEFERKLNTSDARDRQIPVTGTLPVIWAVGADSDFRSMHARAGLGVLDMASGTGKRIRSPGAAILVVHIFLMSLSFLAMFAAMIFARYFKTRKIWLKVHRPLGVGAAISGIAGVITAGTMVQISGGSHIRVLHAVAGLSVIILCAAMPALGFGIFKYKGDKKKIKILHRILGRITILAMTFVIVSGLKTAGIL